MDPVLKMGGPGTCLIWGIERPPRPGPRNKKTVKEYKNFYINYPLRILKENKSKKISFFYPSTKNINYDKGSIYSKIKQKAEIKINAFCLKNKIPIYIHRYPAINSRQSLTLLNQNLPNLLEYLVFQLVTIF